MVFKKMCVFPHLKISYPSQKDGGAKYTFDMPPQEVLKKRNWEEKKGKLQEKIFVNFIPKNNIYTCNCSS